MLTNSAYHFPTKRKSDTVKYGEGESHSKAKLRVINILQNYINGSDSIYSAHKSKIHAEETLHITVELDHYDNNGRGTSLNQVLTYTHPSDIWLHLFVLSTKLTRDIIVEIDGRSHQKQKQQIADRRAVFALQSCKEIFRDFPDVEMIRMDIADAKTLPDDEIVNLVFSNNNGSSL